MKDKLNTFVIFDSNSGTKNKYIIKRKPCPKTNEYIYVLSKRNGGSYRSSIRLTKTELLIFAHSNVKKWFSGNKLFKFTTMDENVTILAFYVWGQSGWHLECTLSFTPFEFSKLVDLIGNNILVED